MQGAGSVAISETLRALFDGGAGQSLAYHAPCLGGQAVLRCNGRALESFRVSGDKDS